MEPKTRVILTVQSIVNISVARAWKYWTTADDIVRWNIHSNFRRTTMSGDEMRAGGKFNYRMETMDGSSGYDYTGTYDYVIYCKQIVFTIEDGRRVQVLFSGKGNQTKVTETFEAENFSPVEEQREDWQNILDSFKKYAERTDQGKKHLL